MAYGETSAYSGLQHTSIILFSSDSDRRLVLRREAIFRRSPHGSGLPHRRHFRQGLFLAIQLSLQLIVLPLQFRVFLTLFLFGFCHYLHQLLFP